MSLRPVALTLHARQALLAVAMVAMASSALAAPNVRFSVREGAMDILIGDTAVAEYVWQDADLPRPYFRQLATLEGIVVSRNYPPDPVADKDNDDHPHFHPGAWLAFGDVGGADFWRNKARVRHITFLEPPRGGEGEGTFTLVNAYESLEESPKTLMMETCAYTIKVAETGYCISASSTFAPSTEGLAFGDQEEMGFGVRLATALSAKHGGGKILNSAGGQQEAGTWGKNAEWCAGYGNIAGKTVGISVMAAPGNFRPSWFHSRDYGLIVANPFGNKAMTGARDAQVLPDSTPIPADGTLRVGFGIFVFSLPGQGDPDFASMYETYADIAK